MYVLITYDVSTISPEGRRRLRRVARVCEDFGQRVLECSIQALALATTLDVVRGCEGEAARVYFESFHLLLKQQREHFALITRSCRPPRDPINALLSFVYSVLTHDMAAEIARRSVCVETMGR